MLFIDTSVKALAYADELKDRTRSNLIKNFTNI